MSAFNWRRPVIGTLLAATGSPILKILSFLKSVERRPAEELLELQRQKLDQVLRHSLLHVPYYRELFRERGLDAPAGLTSDSLKALPALTKEIIRARWNDLQSTDPERAKRKPYRNTSGGSTGQPVEFTQDQHYLAWNIATKLYLKSWAGQEIGEPEVRLWGAERDILQKHDKPGLRLKNWLYHRTDLNALRMGEEQLGLYSETINQLKPGWIEAYVQSIYELARYAEESRIAMHSPRGILTSAGTLYPPVRETIERVFRCPVYNRYGSREVGDMACGCGAPEGLHELLLSCVIEVLDERMEPVPPGTPGRVYVTTLNNFTMPLLRYDIGDYAVLPQDRQCACGRGWPTLASVKGREVSLLKSRDGALVDGQYFTRAFYYQKWCRQFQVVQEDYDHIVVRVVVTPGLEAEFAAAQKELADTYRKVLGPDCVVEFRAEDQIEPLPSGKHVYTYSKVPGARPGGSIP